MAGTLRPRGVPLEGLPPAEAYRAAAARKALFLFLALGAVGGMALVATAVGGARLGIGEVARALGARLLPFLELSVPRSDLAIVWHLRLPRIALGILAGFGLGLAGAAMQGALRNPLVSPFTLGVSAGATLGASLAIVAGFGLVGAGRYVVMGNAFLFAMGACLIILAVGRLRGVSPECFILVGIALTYLFGAATSVLQYLAEEGDLARVVHWMFGSLAGASREAVLTVAGVIGMAFPFLLRASWDLNALAQGDEVARALGVNPGRVRMAVMALSSLIAATITCFTGLIGFVGLVAPHIARLLLGTDHRYLLPGAGLLGAVLLLAADTVGRTLFSPLVIPVGIVISVVGAPFFLALLLRRRRAIWR